MTMKKIGAVLSVPALGVWLAASASAQPATPATPAQPAAGTGQPATPATPAQPAQLSIVSFTGQVQIKMPTGEVIGIVPGGAAPAVPAGAEVIVVSGDAVFQSGQTAIKAAAGDSFSFGASGEGASAQVQIAATGDKTAIKVTVGNTEATVTKGAALSVNAAAGGQAQMSVTAGNVQVTVGGQTTTLAAGQTATASVPEAPAATTTAAATTTTATETAATTETAAETATEETTTVLEPPPLPPPNPTQETGTASAN